VSRISADRWRRALAAGGRARLGWPLRWPSGGRGQLAVLTRAGLTRLEQAYPTHLAGVRAHVMDHLAGLDLAAFTHTMSCIAAAETGPPVRRAPPATPA
jgi:hypothetical protein